MPKGKTSSRDDGTPCEAGMVDQADLKELITFKELALSNMWGIAALIEVLERKGTLTRQEIRETINLLRKRHPEDTT